MLSETNRIDIVARNQEGEIILVISATENWSAEPHALDLLSDKIDTYVAFMKDPQFKAEHGDAPAHIELVAIHEPTAEVRELLDAASAATGVRMSVRTMEIDVEGLFSGAPPEPKRERAPSRKPKQKEKPPRSEAPSKAASKKRGRSPARPASLEQLMSATGLKFAELDDDSLVVQLEGERVDQIMIHAGKPDEDTVAFALILPELSGLDREAAIDNLLRTTFSANYVKVLSSEEQLLLAVELPMASLTPEVVEGVVKGLGHLADANEDDLADRDSTQGRTLECMMAQAAHITVDVELAETDVRAELEAAGLPIKREFDDAVLTAFAKVGDADIDLLARYHERAVSFIVYMPGLQPKGDTLAYLGRLLELNAGATVARVGIDNDGDVALLYEVPEYSPGMFREVATQFKMLFQAVLEVHADA